MPNHKPTLGERLDYLFTDLMWWIRDTFPAWIVNPIKWIIGLICLAIMMFAMAIFFGGLNGHTW